MKFIFTTLIVLAALGHAAVAVADKPKIGASKSPVATEERVAENKAEKASNKSAKKAKKAKKTKEKLVCRNERVTGSRVRERVCRTQAQWDRLQGQARENYERSYENRNRNIGSNDSQ